jgi:hypothetical protein
VLSVPKNYDFREPRRIHDRNMTLVAIESANNADDPRMEPDQRLDFKSPSTCARRTAPSSAAAGGGTEDPIKIDKRVSAPA